MGLSGNRIRIYATAPAASRRSPQSGALRAGEKRQEQNRLTGLILYNHHKSRIVAAAILSQLPDCVLGIRKCRCNVWQIRAIRIINDPIPSAYREEVSWHRMPIFRLIAPSGIAVCDPIDQGAVTISENAIRQVKRYVRPSLFSTVQGGGKRREGNLVCCALKRKIVAYVTSLRHYCAYRECEPG
jgi:hypothetical protein